MDKNEKIIYKKHWFLVLVPLVVLVFIYITVPARSQVKSYYSGDAINYRNQLIIGSVNMGEFELLKLEDEDIIRTAHFKSSVDRLSKNDNFFDLEFSIEDDILYVYLVDGRYLYKYNITDLNNPKLVRKLKDNSWDWFMGVEVLEDKFYTTGPKEVKLWKRDFTVIDTFRLSSFYQGNIQISQSGNYIFQIDKDLVTIFDTWTRQVVAEREILANNEHNRVLYNDNINSMLYYVDDEALKKIDFSGRVQKQFYHISDVGYDVAGLDDRNYIYFSDGVGVVKSRKNDLEPIDWVFTTDITAPNGWAIGLEIVPQEASEKVVVFNNSSILVLDQELDLVAFYESQEEAEPGPSETLFLAVDKNRAGSGSLVSLRGGGFVPEEELEITFVKEKTKSRADSEGRFSKIITVPEVTKPGWQDIKVVGLTSGLSYSISFEIE